jgi:hypothetical protein
VSASDLLEEFGLELTREFAGGGVSIVQPNKAAVKAMASLDWGAVAWAKIPAGHGHHPGTQAALQSVRTVFGKAWRGLGQRYRCVKRYGVTVEQWNALFTAVMEAAGRVAMAVPDTVQRAALLADTLQAVALATALRMTDVDTRNASLGRVHSHLGAKFTWDRLQKYMPRVAVGRGGGGGGGGGRGVRLTPAQHAKARREKAAAAKKATTLRTADSGGGGTSGGGKGGGRGAGAVVGK